MNYKKRDLIRAGALLSAVAYTASIGLIENSEKTDIFTIFESKIRTEEDIKKEEQKYLLNSLKNAKAIIS